LPFHNAEFLCHFNMDRKLKRSALRQGLQQFYLLLT
jgi:hypothetical protein